METKINDVSQTAFGASLRKMILRNVDFCPKARIISKMSDRADAGPETLATLDIS